MSVRYWLTRFVGFGFFGVIGEFLIGFFQDVVLNRPLWVYYNGFYTSPESFFYFGLFGCLGFWIYKYIKRRSD